MDYAAREQVDVTAMGMSPTRGSLTVE